MKDGWREQRLGKILKPEYGKPLGDADRKPSGRYPVYGANGEKDRTDRIYFDKPSIIVGRKGSAGEINLTEPIFWPLDVTYFVTFDEQLHDLRFLYYLLKTLDLPRLARGVKPGINRNDVYSQDANVPPLPEQRRIVGILDGAFAGIAAAKANADKNVQNARALFESRLHGVFARPGDGRKDWTLAEVSVVFGRGKSRHRPRNEPKLYNGKYPFIQTGDVRDAVDFIDRYSQTYSETGLAQSKLWPAGTVCITIAANIAETAILGFDACFPDSMIGVVVDERVASNLFLHYLLQSFKAYLKSRGKGSAQDNINMGTFETQRFPFPALPIQRTIAKQLAGLRAQTQQLTSTYQRKLAALDELKKSLLHRAFSGQL